MGTTRIFGTLCDVEAITDSNKRLFCISGADLGAIHQYCTNSQLQPTAYVNGSFMLYDRRPLVVGGSVNTFYQLLDDAAKNRAMTH